MTGRTKILSEEDVTDARSRRLTAMHLQAIENNPLNAKQVAMFEMFEREGWSHERRLDYIRERAKDASEVPAAE